MRWPSSPGHGGVSRPASSFWNFTHITFRPLLFVAGAAACAECPQESAMLLIVIDLCSREHREFRIDLERETTMGGAERAIDVGRIRSVREDEPEIACAFGQRHEQLIRLRGDAHV